MKCVLCFMINNGAMSLEIPYEYKDAITIINGYATCEDHFTDFLFIDHTTLASQFQVAWDAFQVEAGLSVDKYASTHVYRYGKDPR